MGKQMRIRKKALVLISIIILVMLLTLFKKQSKEQKFWNWVSKNKVELENFINSDHKDYGIYKELTKEIKKYNKVLYPEMTSTKNDEIVLIITPDGLSEGVIPTQKLYEARPKLQNWIIKKFRQSKDKIDLNFNGIEYPSSDIEILPELDNEREKVNIKVCIRNMNSDKKKYQSLAWLYLDHILGEYNTITKVGYVDFYHLENDESVRGGITILELRKLIEKELYKVEI